VNAFIFLVALLIEANILILAKFANLDRILAESLAVCSIFICIRVGLFVGAIYGIQCSGHAIVVGSVIWFHPVIP